MGPAKAQNQKEMTQALQRDVAALAEDVKRMRASQDERLAVVTESLRNTLDLVTRINEKMAVMQTTTSDKLNDVARVVGAPTAQLSGKIDAMNDQFTNLANTVAELNSRLGKLDAKLEDVKKMIQTIPQPAAAPPPQGGPPQGANNVGGGGGGGTAPAVSGEKLFDDATRDMQAGNSDLALQGYTEYLKNFPDAIRAPEAQFNIAELYIRKESWDDAVRSYDALINNYPDSSRVSNAHYMRGITLVKLGRRSEAIKELRLVQDKYPSTELARKAREILKGMGAPVSQAPSKKKRS
jgi:TolA-binding protein